MNLSTPKGLAALSIVKRLTESGHTALFAGGCVRDYLLGIQPTDYDIATSATPDEVEKLFQKTIPVGKQFGVMLVVLNGSEFEVATFRTEGGYQDGRRPSFVKFSNAEEDAKRRDFTVNGLFYDPVEPDEFKRIKDYVGGQIDLSKKVIRCIGNPSERFEEDKLRLLRAIRFAVKLNFSIDPATLNEVKKRSSQIEIVSKERIRDEADKILASPHPRRGLELLIETGLWKSIWPCVDPTEVLLGRFNTAMDSDPVGVAQAALWFDLDRMEILGNMRLLRYSNEVIQRTLHFIDRAKELRLFDNVRSGKKTLLLNDPFFNEIGIFYSKCLHGAPQLEVLLNSAEAWNKRPLPSHFLNGEDLKQAGVASGPQMGNLLEEAYLLQLEGVLSDKQSAVTWVKEQIRGQK